MQKFEMKIGFERLNKIKLFIFNIFKYLHFKMLVRRNES